MARSVGAFIGIGVAGIAAGGLIGYLLGFNQGVDYVAEELLKEQAAAAALPQPQRLRRRGRRRRRRFA